MKSNVTAKNVPYVLIVMGLLFYCVSIDSAKGVPTVAASATTRNQYLVEFKSARLRDDLQNRVAALGGKIIDTFPEMKVALIADLSDEAAAALESQTDVADVTLDEFVTALADLRNWTGQLAPSAMPTSTSQPELALYYTYQWDKRVMAAARAWRAGFLGSPDVRVAIIDTGIDPTHPDLVGLIAMAVDQPPFVRMRTQSSSSNFLPADEMAATRDKVNAFFGSQRLLSQGTIFPSIGTITPPAAGELTNLEEMQRQVEVNKIVSWKGYPIGDFVAVGEGRLTYPWNVDDATVTYPVWRKSLELGIKIVSSFRARTSGTTGGYQPAS